MGDLSDRRARKKAQTRELVRSTAHALFARRGFEEVTVADIARDADVAVQTVFNHFATKEELFFDGRAPWVDGPADAVRRREPGTSPLTALRAHLVQMVHDLLSSLATAERRTYLATVHSSEALRTHERELMHEAEQRLSAALLDAWTTPGEHAPPDPHVVAPITAAVWLAAIRVVMVDRRTALVQGGTPEEAAEAAHAFTDRLLGQMETTLRILHGDGGLPHPRTGWPAEDVVRRAG